MELNAYELSLIAGGFTVVGALIGALTTYYLAVHLARRTARLDAGRRLREAFVPELAALNPVNDLSRVNVEQFLLSAFPKHHAAAIEYQFHLDEKKREGFLIAWRAYHEVGGSVRFFDYYMGDQPYAVFQQRIGAILAYTDT